MQKIISPFGWDLGPEIVSHIPISSRGLIGNDRSVFIKRASEQLAFEVDKVNISKDEYPVHIIALGCHEKYGANRNADTFFAEDCRDYYDTFTKYARFFRNHKNKPENGDPWYGVLKAAAWLADMGQVHLLSALNANEKACEKNGGLVADREIQSLSRNEILPTSMACLVPHDECSYCHHKATKRADYCRADKCKAGGCHEKLGHVVYVDGDQHRLCVSNPKPRWMDISSVWKNADAISFGMTADYLLKAAGVGAVYEKIAEIQEAVVNRDDDSIPERMYLSPMDTRPYSDTEEALLKIAFALSKIERRNVAHDPTIVGVFRKMAENRFPVRMLAPYGTALGNHQAMKLAQSRVVLSFRDFAEWKNAPASVAKEAESGLGRSFSRVLDGNETEVANRVQNGRWPMKAASHYPESQTSELTKAASAFSWDRDNVTRLSRSAVFAPPVAAATEKKAGVSEQLSPAATSLLREFALYKISALLQIVPVNGEGANLPAYALAQNFAA